MQIDVVGNDGGADEAGHIEPGPVHLGHPGHEEALEHFAPVGLHGDGGDEEQDAHEHHQGGEHLFHHLILAGEQQARRDGEHDDGPHDLAGVGHDGLQAQDAAGDVAGLIGYVADEHGADDQDGQQDAGALAGVLLPERFAQADLLHDAQLGRHALQDDDRDGGEQQRPQQGVAVAGAGNGAGGDGAGANEGGRDDGTGAYLLEPFPKHTN